jgi:hypothetical protein
MLTACLKQRVLFPGQQLKAEVQVSAAADALQVESLVAQIHGHATINANKFPALQALVDSFPADLPPDKTSATPCFKGYLRKNSRMSFPANLRVHLFHAYYLFSMLSCVQTHEVNFRPTTPWFVPLLHTLEPP